VGSQGQHKQWQPVVGDARGCYWEVMGPAASYTYNIDGAKIMSATNITTQQENETEHGHTQKMMALHMRVFKQAKHEPRD
jgi:hypothetical protein